MDGHETKFPNVGAQHALVSNSSISAPFDKHSVVQCRREYHELHFICPGRNDDLARARRPHQPIPRRPTGTGTSQCHVGPWHDEQVADSLHVLLVSILVFGWDVCGVSI